MRLSMRYVIEDDKYSFYTSFDTETGIYARTGIIDTDGNDTEIDPFMASFPHLIDVGVMGHCIHGKTGLCVKAGVECYQDGLNLEQPNMNIEEAWNSVKFEEFRKRMHGACPECNKRELCMDGCPLMPEIVFVIRWIEKCCLNRITTIKEWRFLYQSRSACIAVKHLQLMIPSLVLSFNKLGIMNLRYKKYLELKGRCVN